MMAALEARATAAKQARTSSGGAPGDRGEPAPANVPPDGRRPSDVLAAWGDPHWAGPDPVQRVVAALSREIVPGGTSLAVVVCDVGRRRDPLLGCCQAGSAPGLASSMRNDAAVEMPASGVPTRST